MTEVIGHQKMTAEDLMMAKQQMEESKYHQFYK
jgi:hypothetical protein